MTNRSKNWLIGVGLGALVGVIVVLWFAPLSGRKLRAAVRQHYQDALEQARQAGEQRRAELEAELARAQGRLSR
jgi:gas vesicle protein